MQIFKYKIVKSKERLQLPKGAQILSVGTQGNDLYFWALVDPKSDDLEDRFFKVFGTGWQVPKLPGGEYKFLGTGFMDDGLVFHLFEVVGIKM